jgi:putative ABC transport system permease protein
LWRKPVRTALLLVSLSVAFLLFGLLQGVDSVFNSIIARQKLDRLLTDPKFARPLPLAYAQRVEKVPGVTRTAWTQFLPGYYQERTNGLFIVNTVPERWFAVRDEFTTSREAFEAMKRTPAGLLLRDNDAKRFNLKVGDRLTLQSQVPQQDGSTSWTYDIVGLFSNTINPEGRGFAIANYSYWDEARVTNKGTVARVLSRIADPQRSVETARAIDRMFENSPEPTRTKSESELVQRSIATVGDVKFFTRGIMGAVFFALLFLTVNTLLEAVRERTPELAVLKTLGFTDRRVLVIVIAESVLLCLIAAVIGLAAAAAVFPITKTYLDTAAFPPIVFAMGAGVSILLALVSSVLPAWRAQRLSVVEALAGR